MAFLFVIKKILKSIKYLICKRYYNVKRYYNASLNNFYVKKRYTQKEKKKKKEGAKEAYYIVNGYLHTPSQKKTKN